MNELKFNSQICTTKEQSQRLLELGLKPETADMSIVTNAVDCDGIKYSLTPYSETNHPKIFGVIPAWSLHRLLCMLYTREDVYPIMPTTAYDDIIDEIETEIECGGFNKQYLRIIINEVSITINGVRYDSVEANTEFTCEECHLRDLCGTAQYTCLCHIFDMKGNQCFKKSDKKFEK